MYHIYFFDDALRRVGVITLLFLLCRCSVLVHIIFTSICSRDLNWILWAKLYTFSCFSYSHKQIYRLFGRFKLHKIKLYFVRVPRCIKAWANKMKKMCRNARSNAETFSRCCLCGFEKFKNNLHSTLSRCWPRPMQKLYLYVELFKRAEYWLSAPDTTSLTVSHSLSRKERLRDNGLLRCCGDISIYRPIFNSAQPLREKWGSYRDSNNARSIKLN